MSESPAWVSGRASDLNRRVRWWIISEMASLPPFTPRGRAMLYSSAVPLNSLVLLCRALRHGLSAGLSLLDVFRQQALKGPAGVRPVAAEITLALEKGESLQDALKEHPERFPPLFL